MRNLGRGGLSEAENSTKWKCYCCAPEKIKKHTEFAEVQKKPEIIRYFRICLRLFFRNYKKQINSDQNGNKKKNEKQKSENL